MKNIDGLRRSASDGYRTESKINRSV